MIFVGKLVAVEAKDKARVFVCQVHLVLLTWIPWFLRMKHPGESEEPSPPHSQTASQSRKLSSPGSTTTSSSSAAARPANTDQLSLSLSRLRQHSQLNGDALYVGVQATAEPEPPQRSRSVSNGRVGRGDGGEGASVERGGPSLVQRLLPSSKSEVPQLEGPTTPGPDASSGSSGGDAVPHPPGGLTQSPVVRRQLQALLAEVQFLVERVKEQDRQLRLAEQWQFAASVIDRLFLMGFSVFNIICTIAILMAAPHFGEALSKDFL